MTCQGILEKNLARYSQECSRLDADHWRVALTNGSAFTVDARRDEGFLLLDAAAGANLAAGQLLQLMESSLEFPGAVKFARRSPNSLRLRAEFPLPEESEAVAGRVQCHLDGMRHAAHLISEPTSCEAAGILPACPEPSEDGQAGSGSLADLIREAGWEYHERPGGALLADLECGGPFLQAEIEPSGAGARFRVSMYRDDAIDRAARETLCLYLLEANAALRYARAFLQREGEGASAGFEVRVENQPTPGEAGHALAALSVAGRYCARELELLTNNAVSRFYRSARTL